jgi:phenylalanyl-tRNA synthetase beta chain
VDDASPWSARAAVRVDNPTREQEPLLRRSLLGPLLRSLERNRARGVEGVRLFEIGTVFLPDPQSPRPTEPRLLSGIVEGDYADARGAVDAALERLGLAGRARFRRMETPPPPFADDRTASVEVDGRLVGVAGALGGDALAALAVHHEGLAAAAFEMRLDLLAPLADIEPRLRPLSGAPQLHRDVAVVLADGVDWSRVEERVREAAGGLLRDVRLFDEYRGRGIAAGERSLAFRVVLGAADRTLRGEEADGAVAAVVAALAASFGARLRGPA